MRWKLSSRFVYVLGLLGCLLQSLPVHYLPCTTWKCVSQQSANYMHYLPNLLQMIV